MLHRIPLTRVKPTPLLLKAKGSFASWRISGQRFPRLSHTHSYKTQNTQIIIVKYTSVVSERGDPIRMFKTSCEGTSVPVLMSWSHSGQCSMSRFSSNTVFLQSSNSASISC